MKQAGRHITASTIRPKEENFLCEPNLINVLINNNETLRQHNYVPRILKGLSIYNNGRTVRKTTNIKSLKASKA